MKNSDYHKIKKQDIIPGRNPGTVAVDCSKNIFYFNSILLG